MQKRLSPRRERRRSVEGRRLLLRCRGMVTVFVFVFRFFRQGQNVCNRIPIPRSSRGLQNPFYCRPGELGTRQAVRAIHIEFSALYMQLLRGNCELTKLVAACWIGKTGKKGDEKFAGIEIAALNERVCRNHCAQFGGGAQNNIRVKSECLQDCVLDALNKPAKILFVGGKMTLPLCRKVCGLRSFSEA